MGGHPLAPARIGRLEPVNDQKRIRTSGFRPAAGLRNAHAQTLAGGLLPARLRAPVERERWELPDGDFADVDWAEPGAPRGWALVLPGLVGDLRSPYATRMFNHLYRRGYRTGLLNYRGLSGTPNRFPAAYHAGFTRDLDLIARRLNRQYGPGIAVGYSMGGNLLLKWLGENGNDIPLRAAVAVSVPFRLAPAADHLSDGPARFYGRHLTRLMLHRVRSKFSITPPHRMPSLERIRTLRDFDEHVTAPLHGFEGARDYYERNSCVGGLQRIPVPTLIVNAMDDPLVPRDTLPGEEALSSRVTLELSQHGGHIGFVGRGAFGRPRFWLEDHILEFLERHPGKPAS